MRLEPIQSVFQAASTFLARCLKKEPRPYHIIDPHIAPLVHTMNNHAGIRTVASCQGHFFGFRPPYVYFKASNRFVQQLEVLLREAHSDKKLNFCWRLKGIFDENSLLTFILYSPELDSLFFDGILPPLVFLYGRDTVNKDFQTIGEFISGSQLNAIEGGQL